ncbi:MAG: DUF1549 domain-containing protein [Mariniblastus sp.]
MKYTPYILTFALMVFALTFRPGSTGATTFAQDNNEKANHAQFTSDVLPILSKLGCNSGACHGALAGKGGLKLSLNAYDPSGDHFAITKQSRGRRIEFSDPGRSLILTKPTGALPHKGGLKLDRNSKNYKVLANWIANGAVGPDEKDASLEKLTVEPNQISLDLDETQQLKVTAYYSDGKINDVTSLAKYTSTNLPAVTVDESGTATVVGRGEAAVVVWFSSQLSMSKILVPFDNKVDAATYKNSLKKNFIDELVLAKLKLLNLKPSPRSDDATFIRRAYLDTIGMLPTAKEAEAFANDDSTDKRDNLIDELLARDEFVDYWTYRWSDVLLINGKRLRPQAVKAYYQWLRGNIEKNTPWDVIVREIVTSQGSSYENGATNFYALHQTPEDMAENVSQAFLGLSIGCAKCHNHPLEKWTNDQYYAMANMFSRVRAKGWGGDARNGDGLRTLMVASSGDLNQPLTGKPQPPAPLDGQPLDFDDPSDRRVHLAKWLTAKENPYFSRSVVNRVWANFMGRGLVENVDDMRVSNPATNEPLLAALSDFVVEENYDLKSLMRLILQSETYQRSSETIEGNELDDRFYARYYPRRLMAEVLLDAVSQVSEVPTSFTQIAYRGADVKNTKAYPLGTRALELHDSAVVSQFLSTFGRNTRDIVCDCERTNKPSMVQVLHIANGTTINEKLKNEKSCITEALKLNASEETNSKIIYEAYLKTLSRLPSKKETTQLLEVFNDAEKVSRREVIEDLYWSLMSSREFLFQH